MPPVYQRNDQQCSCVTAWHPRSAIRKGLSNTQCQVQIAISKAIKLGLTSHSTGFQACLIAEQVDGQVHYVTIYYVFMFSVQVASYYHYKCIKIKVLLLWDQLPICQLVFNHQLSGDGAAGDQKFHLNQAEHFLKPLITLIGVRGSNQTCSNNDSFNYLSRKIQLACVYRSKG